MGFLQPFCRHQAGMAYVLIEGTCRLALQATDLADATCGTIRRKLFKIGALVTISVRRIKFAMASGPSRTSAASGGPFYFAWGCFRDFVSGLRGVPPHSASKTRVNALMRRCAASGTRDR